MKLYSSNNDYKLYFGNMIDLLDVVDKETVDSVITDPPYELNFMSKNWDNSGIAFQVDTWKKCYEVLKPGGYLLAFGGSRTFHRIACAIEDAGFEIRDTIMWLYGMGFPKSQNIGKQLEKRLEDEKTKQKTEHDLRLMWERDIQKTMRNEEEQNEVLQSQLQEQSLQSSINSTSDVRGEEPCLEGWNNIQKTERELQRCKVCEMSKRVFIDGEERWICNGTQISDGTTLREMFEQSGSCASYRPQSEQQQDRELDAIQEQCRTQESREVIEYWNKFGTALKPSFEPIIVARKPFKGSLVDNVIEYGVGGINIDECRVGTTGATKRSCQAEYPKKENGTEDRSGHWARTGHEIIEVNAGRFPANTILTYDETPSDERLRYFYCAKASAKDRNEGLAIDKKNGVESEIIGKRSDEVLKSMQRFKEQDGRKHKNNFENDGFIRKATNEWKGWGTALKPSFEPIIVARKPFKGSLVDNVIEYGVGGINIDECRVGETGGVKKINIEPNSGSKNSGFGCNGELEELNKGRFPANTILTYDETDFEEVCGGFPYTKSQIGARGGQGFHNCLGRPDRERKDGNNLSGYEDSGSASRYFYCAKASKKDRDEGLDIEIEEYVLKEDTPKEIEQLILNSLTS